MYFRKRVASSPHASSRSGTLSSQVKFISFCGGAWHSIPQPKRSSRRCSAMKPTPPAACTWLTRRFAGTASRGGGSDVHLVIALAGIHPSSEDEVGSCFVGIDDEGVTGSPGWDEVNRDRQCLVAPWFWISTHASDTAFGLSGADELCSGSDEVHIRFQGLQSRDRFRPR